ncbi:MAG: hypothetical protein COA96_10530 [SAR86 cluster bacterium]|uniref:DUF2834 domain-containing protein n=1 Tax=SAR86 cluster bacterium TaxID=2030880 RepID=A0A2A5AXK9_9GAMM|nr:MAG: hypothetical protein COA96_10530 [SAR86 cluster bacterium]
MKITGLQIFYGLTAIVGLFVTWYFNLQPREIGFIADLYTTSASASITNDLSVVVTTFLVWSFVETGRLKMSYRWWSACFVFTFLIAAASTVPLFMLMRERRLLASAEANDI